jgi:hypothetical protein
MKARATRPETKMTMAGSVGLRPKRRYSATHRAAVRASTAG